MTGVFVAGVLSSRFYAGVLRVFATVLAHLQAHGLLTSTVLQPHKTP